MIPPCYDFESITQSINDKHGKLKANHYFELSRDAEGFVVVRIARFIRSEKFIIKNQNETDPTAFRIFTVGIRLITFTLI
jgi:hypothetical protein